ncbi:rab-GTPase-TBC domain-containing protein, partial [Dimargaris cristalligena]
TPVHFPTPNNQARKMVIYGIPTTLRPRVWQFFAEEAKIRQSGFYEDLLNRERIPIFDVIERDIPRCYPDHQLFCDNQSEGQRQLFDILKAYAHYNPEVGYCQGMGRLVGVFLMQHMSAEDSFWLLAATIRQYLPQYYVPTLTQVRIDSAVFEKLLQEHNRKLANHFAVNDITPLMYVTSWFMTLFTMTLPWASVLRVWDWFYLKGTKILFRIGLAILDCISDHLLTECPTNSEILQYLLHIPKDKLAPEHLFAAANRVRIKTHHIDRLSRQVTLHGVPARGELSTSESRSPQKSSKRRVFQRVFSP